MKTRATLLLSLFAACSPAKTPIPDVVDKRPPPIIDEPRSITPLSPPPMFGATVTQTRPPPALVGGTLAIVQDGPNVLAVAADADRDRISVVDLTKKTVLQTIDLGLGAEPGRAIADDAARVHVVLRGSGELVTLTAPWTAPLRRAVCALPRGVAYDAAKNEVLVACAGGELVALPPSEGAPLRTLHLPDDLRDVVVVKGTVMVSRLRSAEVLTLAADGTVAAQHRPPSRGVGGPKFTASAAIRLVAAGESALLLHQRGLAETVGVAKAGGYGGPDPCAGPIVQTTVAKVQTTYELPTIGAPIANAVVPVDLAVHETEAAVIAPGNAFSAGGPTIFFIGMRSAARGIPAAPAECMWSSALRIDAQPTAAAYDAYGTLFVQAREPAAIFRVKDGQAERIVALSNESKKDTGHDVFFANAGGNIACASCHLEGADDGRTWTFEGIGPRRTHSLRGGIAGGEPFHWDGDQRDFAALASEVFERRMSGPPLDAATISAAERWINTIPLLPAKTPSDPAAVERGRTLFEGAAECTACHSGATFSNNATVDVGTGDALQVPSLRGLAWRAPYLHDGSAATLHDRFVDSAQHGDTAGLSGTDIDDLVAYLETL